MAKSVDKDLALKLQFRRILFSQGYWTPLEVELSNYEELGTSLKRRTLTDVDVLGIKFDQLFNRCCAVGDCKSGKNVSDSNRLFWLKGVKDYFGSDLAYYLRPSVDIHIAAIAPKMGLCALAAQQLNEIERKLDVESKAKALGNFEDYQTMVDMWGIQVNEGDKPTEAQLRRKKVYSFLSYSYWYVERFRALMQLVGSFETVADLLNPEDPRDVLLAYVGAERYAHCLLEGAYYVHSHGESNIPTQARAYFFGGLFGRKEKERVFELIRKLGITGEELDPPWLQDTIELLGRMIQNPVGACDVLRHLSVFYSCCVLKRTPSLVALNNGSENLQALVLAKDIAFQFAKATGMNEAIFDNIKPL